MKTKASREDNAIEVAAGVEALIDKLRNEGTEQGQQEARTLVAEAEKRAQWIVKQAQDEAEIIRQQAREEAEELHTAAIGTIHTAARDTALLLKNELTQSFRLSIQRMVSKKLREPKMLEKLLLGLAADMRKDLKLDQHDLLVALNTTGAEDSLVADFFEIATTEWLRQGVTLSINTEQKHGNGLSIQVDDEDVKLLMDENTISDLLLSHVLPRFRNMLDSVFKET